ncbi:hypothetical protein GGR56DRAFT_251600 [Xylariaceae sp. FL0804]|nr:hypothetical protein GGR56DRAFT_251600 [Xylariaceae sp. FL0804]
MDAASVAAGTRLPGDESADPDTCRICRGEGTSDEPLFYPCKCSGSIKYVHQDCLMEWLSHSQKKHCELCKTPFRFTKLYKSNMPKHIPPHVFVTHMTRYLFRNVLVWLRAALVASVWLGCLPYLMRWAWSFLFWVSDEGFGPDPSSPAFEPPSAATLAQAHKSQALPYVGTTTCPATPLLAATTTAASVGETIDGVLKDFLKQLNASAGRSWLSTLLGLAPRPELGVDVSGWRLASSPRQADAVTITPAQDPHHSLLSDVGILKNITRNPSINRIVISILEGQVITLLVIVCFILIILVRDYVVQQQPEINMRAAFVAAEEDEPPAVEAADGALPGPEPEPELRGQDDDFDDSDDGDDDLDSTRAVANGDYDDGEFILRPPDLHPRPNAEVLAELRRWATEDDVMPPASGPDAEAATNPEHPDHPDLGRAVPTSSSIRATSASSDGSSWTWADAADTREDTDSSREKDKGKANSVSDDRPNMSPSLEDVPPGSDSSSRSPNILRPRAISDGPRHVEAVHPLANNNWSFSALPSDGTPPRDAMSRVDSASRTEWDGAPPHPAASPLFGSAEIPGVLETPPGHPADPIEAMNPPIDDLPATQPLEHDVGAPDTDEVPALAQAVEPAAVAEPPPPAGGIVDRVANFMWGDMNAAVADDLGPEEAVDIFGDNHQEAAFLDDGDEDDGDVDVDELEMAPDVVEAAVAAGLDPEAVDDAEDFEGIMELIGMRGPVVGLFQNVIFCAFLVASSVFLGIFVPYNIGRISFWVLANPTRIIRMAFSSAKLVQDGVLLAVGYTSTLGLKLLNSLRIILGVRQGRLKLQILAANSGQLGSGALERIANSLMSEVPFISASEIRNFSSVSHEALVLVKSNIYYAFSACGRLLLYVFDGDYGTKWTAARDFAAVAAPAVATFVRSIPGAATRPSSWMISLSLPDAPPSSDVGLAYWDANDRMWAILLGYTSTSLLAALYLGRGTPFSTGRAAQEWEASIIDGLNQASGVMKVILIISIEMLIFPLYCGLLLDFALLPLFESTSLKSRLLFTYNYPLTSIFVHWFVGTGYMFHFALFVSMCRKIMRKGVLFFIRDPDDPEFHPVRDVLERNVTTQLRKILFSAFIYGTLVVACLGGVVWGLSLALPNVLPVHYSSNEPVLEFPIDLLFYNFLMPLAVKFFKPSDGLHAMYTWWFRKCARMLRLTWFLFGERQVDEEGWLTLARDSPHRRLSWWRRVFLEINSRNEVVPKSWYGTFAGGRAKPSNKVTREEMGALNLRKRVLVHTGELIPNGRFVRAPASDQVKVPKGQAVFLDVPELDVSVNGRLERPLLNPDMDFYAGDYYQFVYVPPWFRVRITLLILFIWAFAAVTGVGFTIVPLVFGRRMFKALIPSHIRTNDIYAFSIGMYILGSLSYLAFHLRSITSQLRAWGASAIDSVFDRRAIGRVLRLAQTALRLAYTYTNLLVIFPLLITILVELYVLIPLHTYVYPPGWSGSGSGFGSSSSSSSSSSRLEGLRDGHTIRVVQAWTLGILYLKLGSRALTLYGGRPAQAVRAVLRRGWLEPDVGVLTRAFVIPGVAASLVMILAPPLGAWTALRYYCGHGHDGTTDGMGMAVSVSLLSREAQVLTYRLAYPLTALLWASLVTVRRMIRVLEGWKVRIRDEAYLMGERLQNFSGVTARGASMWRGSTRL